MLYACEVWGEEKGEAVLEKMHLRFLKHLLKVKMSSYNNMVYGELGRFPIDNANKKQNDWLLGPSITFENRLNSAE